MKAPEISVGIVSGSDLTFTLNGNFHDTASGGIQTGRRTARVSNGRITVINGEQVTEAGEEVTFTPAGGQQRRIYASCCDYWR